MIHLISFSLYPPRDARLLYEDLTSSTAWMHEINDTWLIDTIETTQQVMARLSKYFQDTDRVLVLPLGPGLPQGLLSPQGWTWLNTRLANQYPFLRDAINPPNQR